MLVVAHGRFQDAIRPATFGGRPGASGCDLSRPRASKLAVSPPCEARSRACAVAAAVALTNTAALPYKPAIFCARRSPPNPGRMQGPGPTPRGGAIPAENEP